MVVRWLATATWRPPPELQAWQAAARLSASQKRSGRWLEGMMWWTLVAWPVQRGPRIRQA